MVIYLSQEGRGIGILEKLKAYNLQDRGFDTVEANLQLGHAIDNRSYQAAADIIHSFGLEKIELLTNNPQKVKGLVEAGVNVIRMSSTPLFLNPENSRYLQTKQTKLEHVMKVT